MALWFISGPGHFMPPAKPVSRLSREAPASLLNYLYCQELSKACLSDKGWVESLNPPQSGPFSIWQNPSFSSLGRKCPSSTCNCKEWPHVIFFLPFTLPSLYLECIPCPYRGTLPGERLNQSTSPHLTSTSLLSLSWCYNDPVRSGKHRPSAHHVTSLGLISGTTVATPGTDGKGTPQNTSTALNPVTTVGKYSPRPEAN